MQQNRRINLLPDSIINQIAAGEVVDGPASVVKELIENSLDAGSTDICVNLSSGGLDTIEVIDNGRGILKNDLKAAITRHYTSKLDESSDVLKISSLGFRGEALASITSVAEVELSSRHESELHPWMLSTKPDSLDVKPVPCAGNIGTKICINNLFFNVPARKAFLKQPRTEFFKVKILIRQFAFAFPNVRFRLRQAGLRGLSLSPARTMKLSDPRWNTLFGNNLAKSLVPIESEYFGGKISGWVSNTAFPSSRSDRQCLAINGRIVRDKVVQHAVKSAYGPLVAKGEFAFYALSIVIQEQNVDVNVHPAKLEVKIKNSRELYDLVYISVRDALGVNKIILPDDSQNEALGSGGRFSNHKTDSQVYSQSPNLAFSGQPLVVVDTKYLLFLLKSDVRVLNMYVAWATILDERLRISQDIDQGNQADLLVPERVPPQHAEVIMLHSDQLRKVGFGIEDLGLAGALVRNVPKILPKIDVRQFLILFSARLLLGENFQSSLMHSILNSIEYFDHNNPNYAMLDEMARSASAARIDLISLSVLLDGEFIARGLKQ